MLLLFAMTAAAATAAPAMADAGEHAHATAQQVKIITLNLYHDKDNWPARRDQIVEELQRLQADVIALQEVIEHDGFPNQARWLATRLGYDWYFASTDPVGKRTRYGNALLTRRPVLARGQKWLRPLDDSRTAAFLRIDLGGHAANVYVTHLHWTQDGAEIRRRQVDDLVEYIGATSAGVPSLVAGDFNAEANTPELETLRLKFADASGDRNPDADPFASSTLNPAYHSPRRIDHVFFQRGAFLPVSTQLLFVDTDAHGTWASDHRGVLAALQLAGDTDD